MEFHNVTFFVEGKNQSDFFHNSPGTKIGLIMINSICQLVSISLYPCIILYEYRSGDPMKRTILNKLVTGYCLSCLIFNMTCGTFLQIRFFSGNVLSYNFTLWAFELPKTIIVMIGMLFCFEYMIVRYLCICYWKRAPPPINEDFLAIFLAMMNLCLATFWGVLQTSGHIVSEELLYMLTGVYPPDQNLPGI